jgi:hypothetical protein
VPQPIQLFTIPTEKRLDVHASIYCQRLTTQLLRLAKSCVVHLHGCSLENKRLLSSRARSAAARALDAIAAASSAGNK